MTKRKALIVSAVLIGLSMMIEGLKMTTNMLLDVELVDYFSGALLGSGIGLFLGNIFRKEKVKLEQN